MAESSRVIWHLLTPEYPPDPGGVADYTHAVVAELARRGHDVHVWTPGCPSPVPQPAPGVTVHRRPALWSPSGILWAEGQIRPGSRVVVQYSPYGFGMKGLNLPFCLWVGWRGLARGDVVHVMMHEFAVAFGRRARTMVVAAVQRLMAFVLVRSASRVWVSIRSAEARARRYGVPARAVAWLPVFSNIPVVGDASRVAEVRSRLPRAGHVLVGHFGTHPSPVSDTMRRVLPALLTRGPRLAVVLVGRGSDGLLRTVLDARPDLENRMVAFGQLTAQDVSAFLAACDLWLQPYPEGVTARRTTIMACLAHGRPVVTTTGQHTESAWAESGALRLVPNSDPEVLARTVCELAGDPVELAKLGPAALAWYDTNFGLPRVVDRLEAACGS